MGIKRNNKDEIISALKDIALAVTGSFDIDTLLQSIVETCTKFSNASRGALFLYDELNRELIMRAEKGNSPELRYTARYSTDVDADAQRIGLTTYVFLKNETLVLNSPDEILNHRAHKGKYDDKQYPGRQKCQSWVGIPLADRSKKQTIGVLKIENTIDRKPIIRFTQNEIGTFLQIADIASASILKFQQQFSKINVSISKLTNSFKTSNLLKAKLRDIVHTFKDISQADGASIWLIQGSKLICKSGVGHYEGMEDSAEYDLSFDLKAAKRVGLTAYIAKSGETLNIKSYEALVSHPQHKGTYDTKNYPNSRCESFIGVPLRFGDRIIGVIKADNRIPSADHPQRYFTEEEAQTFFYLANLTAIVVQNDQDFDNLRKRDKKLLTLNQIGMECADIDNNDQILWNMLVGITHDEGIGFNRCILFNFLQSGNDSVLAGRMAIGPKNIFEGTEIQRSLDSRNLILDLTKCKKVFVENDNRPLPSPLQSFIESIRIPIPTDCPISKIARNSNAPSLLYLKESMLSSSIRNFLTSIDSFKTNPEGIIAFSIVDSSNQLIIGICDNVYSPNFMEQSLFEATGSFIQQISLSLSRLSLKRTDSELRERAWREFSAMTAHRIGTETADMSGALNWIIGELNRNPMPSISSYISRLQNALMITKLAVREYTELTRPPEMSFESMDINLLLDDCIKNTSIDNMSQFNVNTNYSSLPAFFGDKARLMYAFTEIIHNSKLEFGEKQGEISISTKMDESNNSVVIEFVDNGNGIPIDILPKVFELGFKGRPKGTGIGLYIVKKTISEHGGHVLADNIKPHGAHFKVVLPLRSNFKYKRVLVIDDTDNLRFDIKQTIRNRFPDIIVDEASNDLKAEEFISKYKYDYVITDVKLDEAGGSKFGGISILESVKRNCSETRTIVVTSHLSLTYRDQENIERLVLDKAKELGATECIPRIQKDNYLDKIITVMSIK